MKGGEHLELEFSIGEMLSKAGGLPSVPMVMSERELLRQGCEMSFVCLQHSPTSSFSAPLPL